jgi:hypothetical protein
MASKAGSEAYHKYPLKTAQQRAGHFWIRWVTNGTEDPDPELSIGSTREITVVRVSKNVYGIGFAHRWARVSVMGQPTIRNSANLLLVNPAQEGYAADNGLSVTLVDGTLTLEAVESDGKTCEAHFFCSGTL